MPVNRRDTEFELSAKDRTAAVLKGVEKNFRGLDSVVGKLGLGLAAVGGVGGIGAVIVSQARGARQALAYSRALGVSTEALTAWQFAGESVGLQADKIADLFKDSSEKIGDAFRNGSGEALEALESLNLSIEDMVNLSPDQQLLQIGKALQNVGTQGEKVQILESLGNDASLLLPLLDDNAAELERLIDRSDQLGVTLTQIEAEKLDRVNEVMMELDGAATGLAQNLAVALGPALADIANWLGARIPEAANFTAEAIDGVINLFAGLEDDAIRPVDTLGDKISGLQRRIELMQQAIDSGDTQAGIAANFKAQIGGLRAELDEALALQEIAIKRQREFDTKFRVGEESAFVSSIGTSQAVGAVGGSDDGGQAEDDTNAALLRQLQRHMQHQTDLRHQQLESLRDRFGDLEMSLQTEEQRLAEGLLAKQALIDQAELAGIESKTTLDELRVQLATQFEEQITDVTLRNLSKRERFQLLSHKKQTKQVLRELTGLTAGVARHNRSLFEINKVAGIAQATINTYEGVSETLSAYPQPLAGILAAAHLAAGLANVDAIRSASFGGGAGSAPSLSGSPGVPVTPVPSLPGLQGASAEGTGVGRQITINVEGNVLATQDELREIVVRAIEDAEANDEITVL